MSIFHIEKSTTKFWNKLQLRGSDLFFFVVGELHINELFVQMKPQQNEHINNSYHTCFISMTSFLNAVSHLLRTYNIVFHCSIVVLNAVFISLIIANNDIQTISNYIVKMNQSLFCHIFFFVNMIISDILSIYFSNFKSTTSIHALYDLIFFKCHLKKFSLSDYQHFN